GFVDTEVNALLDLDTQREVAFSMVSVGHVNQELPAATKEVTRLAFPTVSLSQAEIDYPELREIHEASSLGTREEVTEWRKRAKSSSPGAGQENIGLHHPGAGRLPTSIQAAEEGISIERVILRR